MFSTKLKIIAIVLSVIATITAGAWIYNTGYDNGVTYINQQVTLQKQQWEQQVSQLQTQHNATIASITEQHKFEIDQLNKQIKTLKEHPKIVTKYVDRAVPITKGLELLHDRAVTKVPLYAMLPDGFDINAPSDCSSSDFANTIVDNYNTCNQCIERLTALQRIVQQYQQKQNQIINQEK